MLCLEAMPDEVPETRAHRPRRRFAAILAFVIVVVAATAIWYFTSQGSEPSQAGAANQVRFTLHLESFVLNAADSDQRAYLRVGIDLGLNQEPKRAADTPPVAQVRDTILGVLGEAKVGDLMMATGKKRLKEQILRALREPLPELGVEEVYASAQVDQRKVGKLALAIQVAFQELGAFPASNSKIPLDIQEPMPVATVQTVENVKRNTELGRVSSPPLDTLSAATQEANLATLQAE